MEKLQSKNLTFGEILSDWRKRRRFSQLGFGLSVDVSSRHLSFLETGRANPSREMVLKLTDRLEMPKGEINRALLAAGFAPAYVARPPGDRDLVPIESAIEKMLENHMPYPAISIDKVWNIVGANLAAMQLMGEAGFGSYSNILLALAEQTKEQSTIVNWEEAIGLSLERVRTELDAIGGNSELEHLEKKLTARFLTDGRDEEFDRSQAVIPTKFDVGGRVISVFSTFAQFGTVQDMALDELKIELMFPLDEVSEKYFKN
ncbi:MAG: helix-turn-helix transcriptional regulator [Devosiaceae bacterium]|nr:helix-turn-helix transcriptional regulator [Devosiaceae bacterium]